MSNSLLTEQDGRELAIAMLREAESISSDETNFDEQARHETCGVGTPQNIFALRYLEVAVKHPEILPGFAAVLSDFVVSALDDVVLSADHFEKVIV